ncbi:MAG: hypothetical protein EBR88_07425 [Betaproteobacteria bacterium]|nr:hypothetical protein [Betaproteobacteria bacterium]
MPQLMSAPEAGIRTNSEMREDTVLEILENHTEEFKTSHAELKGMELEARYTGMTAKEIADSATWEANGIRDLPMRTLQRTLQVLVKDGAILSVGSTKGSRYLLANYIDIFADSSQTSF